MSGRGRVLRGGVEREGWLRVWLSEKVWLNVGVWLSVEGVVECGKLGLMGGCG